MEADGDKVTGRTKIVLVVPGDDQQTAVITTVIVRTQEQTSPQRLNFTGVVGFSIELRDHIENILLPIVDQITTSLNLPPVVYEISAVNISAASIRDAGFGISGFSADLPVCISMLSAALDLPLEQNILTTGHIASIAGDITEVRAIPAKLKAAVADDSVEIFIYPVGRRGLDDDFQALGQVRDYLKIRGVRDIGRLLEFIFSEEDIVLSSLRKGFFALPQKVDASGQPVEKAANILLDGNKNRFWSVLRNNLIAGKIESAKGLLRTFADYHIRGGRYPVNIGGMLFNIVCATGPAVRSLEPLFPLIDTGICIELSRLAKETDYEDVPRLLDAAGGRNLRALPPQISPVRTCRLHEQNEDDEIFDRVVSQINELAFAQKYGITIDSARASFVLNSVTVASYQEFIDTVVSFYVHLRCYINKTPVESTDQDPFRNEAIALLEAAYKQVGGERVACQKALDGIDGGMRTILDRLTEEYKVQQQIKYINRVFTETLNSLEWSEKVRFMRSAMKRLKNFLPAEIADEPAQRFARDYEVIVKAYVNSMDKFNQIISRF